MMGGLTLNDRAADLPAHFTFQGSRPACDGCECMFFSFLTHSLDIFRCPSHNPHKQSLYAWQSSRTRMFIASGMAHPRSRSHHAYLRAHSIEISRDERSNGVFARDRSYTYPNDGYIIWLWCSETSHIAAQLHSAIAH